MTWLKKIKDNTYGFCGIEKGSPFKNNDPDKVKAYKKVGIDTSKLSELGLQFDLGKDTLISASHGAESAARNFQTWNVGDAIRQGDISNFNVSDDITTAKNTPDGTLYTYTGVYPKTKKEEK